LRREALDGLAILEVLLNYFWSVALAQAEVPSTFGFRSVVDNGVGTVLAKSEALDGIEANLAEQSLHADLALYSLPGLFCATLLAVTARADEHVRFIVSGLRRGLLFWRLLFLRDGFLRIRPRSAWDQVNSRSVLSHLYTTHEARVVR
jgi:hypothetical protein